MFPPHPLSRYASDAAEISYIPATVHFSIRANDLTIETEGEKQFISL